MWKDISSIHLNNMLDIVGFLNIISFFNKTSTI